MFRMKDLYFLLDIWLLYLIYFHLNLLQGLINLYVWFLLLNFHESKCYFHTTAKPYIILEL